MAGKTCLFQRVRVNDTPILSRWIRCNRKWKRKMGNKSWQEESTGQRAHLHHVESCLCNVTIERISWENYFYARYIEFNRRMNHLLLNRADIHNRDSRINISFIDFTYFDSYKKKNVKLKISFGTVFFLSPIEGEISKWFDKKRYGSLLARVNYSTCSLLLVDIWYFNMARSPVI